MRKFFLPCFVLLACVLITGVFIFCYRRSSMEWGFYQSRPGTDDGAVLFHIDRLEVAPDRLHIDGWAIRTGESVPYYNWVSGAGTGTYVYTELLLKDGSGTVYWLKTTPVDRPDVAQQGNDGIKHDWCGITSTVRTGGLSRSGVYQLMLLTRSAGGKETLTDTGQTVKLL